MPQGSRRGIAWIVLAAVACIGFVLLGNWQVHRLHWKLRLIHAVDTRVHAAPVPAPGPDRWPRIAAGHGRYLHVHLDGHYLANRQTLVRGTSRLGYGFWVMTPFQTRRGFIVLVNRGYIPSAMPGTAGFDKTRPPGGEVRLTGLLRQSEPGGGFLRPNRPARDLWYSRDVAVIAAARHLPAARVAPYFVDAEAVPGGARWPVAGLTVIRFPNHHLGYAITWYALALGCALGVGLLLGHAWRRRDDA